MPFPTTGLVDDFNRADGSLGANWTWPIRSSTVEPMIVGNQVASIDAASNRADTYYSATLFGPDSEVYTTVIVGATGRGVYLYARALNGDAVSNLDAYMVSAPLAFGYFDILRYNTGGATQVGTRISGTTLATGDQLGFEVFGDTPTYLRPWVRRAGDQRWYDVGIREDYSPLTAAGYIGHSITPTYTEIDDFSGGTMVGDPLFGASFDWPTDQY